MKSTTLSAECLSASLATLTAQANAEHREVLAAAQNALDHAHLAGDLLIEAKARCPHGKWGPWLEASFEGSHQSANVYMQVAQNWSEIVAAKSQHAGNLSLRGALKLLAEPRRETARPAWERPAWWSHKEINARAAKRLYIEAAFGAILKWADVNGGGPSHKLFRWLCPAQGWMNRDRALSMILALQENMAEWSDDTHQSELDLLTEVACHYAGILPLEEGGFPIVCMCDLAIGIHKFCGDLSPGEEPHRIAPCEQYQDGCVFSYCHSEADRQWIKDTVEEWLRNGPPENVFEAIFGMEVVA